ncbi:MAG: polysaccharide biosynthesis tyrosine autokinase [bacterium]|jgi:succinoglycan biosynthesis transport protein ExoP
MAENNQESAHFMDYWRMIKSRIEVVIAVFLIVVTAGIIITLTLPKTYMASTRIKVRQDTPNVTPFYTASQQQQMMSVYDMYFLRTEFEVIQSRPILYAVIRNLRLQEEFGRIYSDDGAPLSLAETYRILVDGMKVQQYRDTNLIEVRIFRSSRRSTKDVARHDAARIANEIASVYRDSRMKQTREVAEQGVSALSEASKAQQRKVELAEGRLEEIRRDLKITVFSPNQSGSSVASLENAKLERLELNRIVARKEMLDHATRLKQIENLKGSDLLYSSAYVIQDPTLTTLRQQLTEAETNLKRKQEMFGERHPDVVGAGSVVNDLKRKIEETLKGQVLGLQTSYEIAKKSYEAADQDLIEAKKNDISAHSEQYLPFAKMESEVQRQRQMRDTLETRLVQESIGIELPRTPVEVVDQAEAPGENEPVSPKMVLNVILSIVMGLACGIGLVFFIEYVDTSVKTVDDIEKFIGATIIGIIPQKVRPLSDEGSESPHAEAYRVLRMNLELSKKLGGGNTMCVTSGGAGEGKSLTLFNLAFICSQAGKKVIVIDSDMRRPTQHKMFKVSNRIGLADVLMDKASVDQAIVPNAVGTVDFMPSGKLPSVAHGILSSQRLRALIDLLKTRYDYVFFDSPPIMGVSDAAILCSEVDGVLLVIQHRTYPRAVSLRAKTMVDNAGGNLLGVVLNNLNVTRDYYYYHNAYYNYSYGSSRDRRQEKLDKASAESSPKSKGSQVTNA